MKRIAIFCLFVSTIGFAETSSLSDSFSIGPEGLSLQAPGMRKPAAIKYDGNGVFSTTFSITGNPDGRGRGEEASAPIRLGGPRPVQMPSSFTDSDTFFKGVGRR